MQIFLRLFHHAITAEHRFLVVRAPRAKYLQPTSSHRASIGSNRAARSAGAKLARAFIAGLMHFESHTAMHKKTYFDIRSPR